MDSYPEVKLGYNISKYGSIEKQLYDQGYELPLFKLRNFKVIKTSIQRLRGADLITDSEMNELFTRLTIRISEEIKNEN